MPAAEFTVLEKHHILYLHLPIMGIRESIGTLLSTKHPGAHHMKQRFKYLKDWDGMLHFCKPLGDKAAHQFWAPAGFAQRIQKWAAAQRITYEWEYADQADFVQPPFHQLAPLTLDKDQILACTALLQERRRSIEFGTGSGKTLVAANAILCLEKAIGQFRALMIVPKLTLLYQTQKAFQEFFGFPIGIVGDGKFEWDHPIVIATADTASGGKHLKYSAEICAWLRTINLLILDEAHHTTANRWQELIQKCPAQRLWALSGKMIYFAAKDRHKEMDLEGQFGRPVYSGFSAERTCPVEIVQHKHPLWAGKFETEGLVGQLTDGTTTLYRDPETGDWTTGQWRGPNSKDNQVPRWMLMKDPKTGKWKVDKTRFGIYRGQDSRDQVPDLEREDIIYWTRHDVAIMEFEERNLWAVDVGQECVRRKESFIVTVKRRKHLNRLLKWFRQAGVPVGELGGHLTGKQQTDQIDALRANRVPGIVAILGTIVEGVDLPDLRHIIKLDGMADEQTLEQLKGRLQRIAPGKEKGVLHVPYDEQLLALQKTRGTIVNYYRKKGCPIREVVHLDRFNRTW